MGAKEYAVKKDGEVIKTYKSLPAAKQLAEKEMANVYSDGICIYKVVPEEDESAAAAEPATTEARPEADETTEKFTLTALMNVRKEPSLNAEIIKTLPAGTVVDVGIIRDDWLCLSDGTYILYQGGKFAVKGGKA